MMVLSFPRGETVRKFSALVSAYQPLPEGLERNEVLTGVLCRLAETGARYAQKTVDIFAEDPSSAKEVDEARKVVAMFEASSAIEDIPERYSVLWTVAMNGIRADLNANTAAFIRKPCNKDGYQLRMNRYSMTAAYMLKDVLYWAKGVIDVSPALEGKVQELKWTSNHDTSTFESVKEGFTLAEETLRALISGFAAPVIAAEPPKLEGQAYSLFA